MAEHPPLVVFGGGSMGSTIVRAGIEQEVLDPAKVIICELDERRREILKEGGVRATGDAAEACEELALDGILLLAVKPQSFPALAERLRTVVQRSAPGWEDRGSLVSIMAGVPIAVFARAVGVAPERAVRVMPNLGVTVHRGMSALSAARGASEELFEFIQELFGAIGETITLPEELIDPITALAGSGPAYLFYLAEAMNEAGVRCGFSREQSDTITRQTLLGAAELLAHSTQSATELRKQVTSRGGTTEAAIGVLDSRAVRDAIVHAIEAGAERARELARGF